MVLPSNPLVPTAPVAPAAPAAPVKPGSPWGPMGPVAPVGPCGPVGPCEPAATPGIHLLPLNTRAWPVVGGVVDRSMGMPWSFITRVAFWVPPRSPVKAPTKSQALRAWKAGRTSTSGVRAEPPMVTRRRKPLWASTAAGMAGIPVDPSTTP